MTSPPTFDLQSHSLHSDGALAPAEVVRSAARAGVALMALTDHDTVEGVDDALAAAREHPGLTVVPAVEVSAVHQGWEDLHILGYLIDHHDPELARRLAGARADRELRAQRMGERLAELGFAVDPDPLERRRTQGKPIGRPHLAGAVLSHPDNARRLSEEGHEEVGSLIAAYLIPGAPAYLPRTRPTVGEAIGWIHDACGVAVWAHPFWDIADPHAVLATLRAFAADGIDGVEAFYATHDADQTRLVADAAETSGLLTTGSADFHGPGHRHFPRFRAFALYGHTPRLGPIAGAARR